MSYRHDARTLLYNLAMLVWEQKTQMLEPHDKNTLPVFEEPAEYILSEYIHTMHATTQYISQLVRGSRWPRNRVLGVRASALFAVYSRLLVIPGTTAAEYRDVYKEALLLDYEFACAKLEPGSQMPIPPEDISVNSDVSYLPVASLHELIPTILQHLIGRRSRLGNTRNQLTEGMNFVTAFSKKYDDSYEAEGYTPEQVFVMNVQREFDLLLEELRAKQMLFGLISFGEVSAAIKTHQSSTTDYVAEYLNTRQENNVDQKR